MKKYIILPLIALLAYSCSEDKIKSFDKDSKALICFRTNSGTQWNVDMTTIMKRFFADSTEKSFAGVPIGIIDSIIDCPISLTGIAPTKDIKIKFKVNKELTTGIEGTDYELNLDTTYLRAGRTSTSVRMKIKRTPKLTKEKIVIALELLESEEYEILPTYKNTDVWNSYTQFLNGKTFRTKVSEFVSKPNYWDLFGDDYFGEWTLEKYNIVNTVLNWTEKNWKDAGGVSPITLGVLPYAAFKTQQFLQAQADAPINKPIKDADGKNMQLPKEYAVDYSRYE